MNIRQAIVGAGVAVVLVFGGNVDRADARATALQASSSQPACDIAGIETAVRDAARHAGNVVLDVALDAAGELWARAKQVF